MPHEARVREMSSGRTGTVAGFTQSRDGDWKWAVMMDDDERVWMVSHADTEQID